MLMVWRTSVVVVVVRRRSQCSKIDFSETAGPIKATIYVELPWVGDEILFAASGSRDLDGRHDHVW